MPSQTEESTEEIENSLLAMCGETDTQNITDYEDDVTGLLNYFASYKQNGNVKEEINEEEDDDTDDNYISHLTFGDDHFEYFNDWLRVNKFTERYEKRARSVETPVKIESIASPEPEDDESSWLPQIIEGATYLPKMTSIYSPVKAQLIPHSPVMSPYSPPPLPPDSPSDYSYEQPPPPPPLPIESPPKPPPPQPSTIRCSLFESLLSSASNSEKMVAPLAPPPPPPCMPLLPSLDFILHRDSTFQPVNKVPASQNVNRISFNEFASRNIKLEAESPDEIIDRTASKIKKERDDNSYDEIIDRTASKIKKERDDNSHDEIINRTASKIKKERDDSSDDEDEDELRLDFEAINDTRTNIKTEAAPKVETERIDEQIELQTEHVPLPRILFDDYDDDDEIQDNIQDDEQVDKNVPLPRILFADDDDDIQDDEQDLATVHRNVLSEDALNESMDIDTNKTTDNATDDPSTPFGRPLRRSFANIFDTFMRSLDSTNDDLEPVDEDTISLFAASDDWLITEDLNEPSTSTDNKIVKDNPAGEIKVKNVMPFVSTDESENKDNADPEWEALKKIETDDQRYRVVRLRWKNLNIPDPNINLTTQNFRIRRTEKVVMGKRKMLNDGGPKAKKMRSCIEVFESEIAKMKIQLQDEKNKMKYDYGMKKKQLENERSRQEMRIQRQFYSRRETNMNISRLQQQYVKERNQLQEEFLYTNEQLDIIFEKNICKVGRPIYVKIDRMRRVKEEVMSFNKYYSGLKNSALCNVDRTLLSEERFNEIMEIENVYSLYERYYSSKEQ